MLVTLDPEDVLGNDRAFMRRTMLITYYMHSRLLVLRDLIRRASLLGGLYGTISPTDQFVNGI